MTISLNLNISVPTQAEITDFVTYHGWKATITNENGEEVANPETKAAFAKKKVISFFRESVKAKRSEDASRLARDAKIVEVDNLIIE